MVCVDLLRDAERTGAVAGPEAYGDHADGIKRAKRTWIGKNIVV